MQYQNGEDDKLYIEKAIGNRASSLKAANFAQYLWRFKRWWYENSSPFTGKFCNKAVQMWWNASILLVRLAKLKPKSLATWTGTGILSGFLGFNEVVRVEHTIYFLIYFPNRRVDKEYYLESVATWFSY